MQITCGLPSLRRHERYRSLTGPVLRRMTTLTGRTVAISGPSLLDPGDRSWLKREARQIGVSMEELVRRLIHEKRVGTERSLKPSVAFARHFGDRHGIELPPRVRCGYKPFSFSREEE